MTSWAVQQAQQELIAECDELVATYGLTSYDIERASWAAVLDEWIRSGRRPKARNCRVLVSMKQALMAIVQTRAN